jgi:hypothetical protein
VLNSTSTTHPVQIAASASDAMIGDEISDVGQRTAMRGMPGRGRIAAPPGRIVQMLTTGALA